MILNVLNISPSACDRATTTLLTSAVPTSRDPTTICNAITLPSSSLSVWTLEAADSQRHRRHANTPTAVYARAGPIRRHHVPRGSQLELNNVARSADCHSQRNAFVQEHEARVRRCHGPYSNRFMPCICGTFHMHLRAWSGQGVPPSRLVLQHVRSTICSFSTEAKVHLTHGDLSPHNILVKGSEITGITDWETAGYYCILSHVTAQDYYDVPEYPSPISLSTSSPPPILYRQHAACTSAGCSIIYSK